MCFYLQFQIQQKTQVFQNVSCDLVSFTWQTMCVILQIVKADFESVFSKWVLYTPCQSSWIQLGGGEGRVHSTFSGRGVQPWFPKCGVCELIFASERGVLWTEIFKFRGLRAQIWAKIEACRCWNFYFLFWKEGLVNWLLSSFAWNGTPANYRRGLKRGSSGPYIPIPPF